MPPTPAKTAYCKTCGYDLRASENRCPECARPFDWQNPKTYRPTPRRFPWKRLAQLAAAFTLLLLLLTILVAPDYYQWRRNQHAIDVVTKAGGEFNIIRTPLWWSTFLVHHWDYLGDRVEEIRTSRPPMLGPLTSRIADADLKELRGLKNLKSLRLRGAPDVTDVGLEYIGEMSSLEFLDLRDAQMTAAGLAKLKNLKQLTTLYLGQKYTIMPYKITDSEFKEIGEIPSLVTLDLECDDVMTGLRELRNLPKLKNLLLIGTRVTDAQFQEIKTFKALEFLRVTANPDLTSDAVNQLQTARPTLKIDYVPPPGLLSAIPSQD